MCRMETEVNAKGESWWVMGWTDGEECQQLRALIAGR